MPSQDRSIANFVDQLARKFTFSSSKEKRQFEEQISEGVNEMVESARHAVDQNNNNNNLGQLEGNFRNGSEIRDDEAEEIVHVAENRKFRHQPEFTHNEEHECPRTNFKNNTADDLETLKSKDCERQKVLTKLENRFLEKVKHRHEKFFVEVGFVPIHIWTIKVYPEDPQLYDNTPIVLLHGFGAGICQWVKMFDILSQKRIVYAIDMPGFGKSSRPRFNSDEGHNLTSMIEYLELWRLNVKGLDKPFTLLGHSFGGYLATAYAIRHGTHIKNLILLDPWGIYCHESDLSINRANFDRRIRKYKVTEIIGSFISPMGLMRNTGPIGKFLFKSIRDDLYGDFEDTVDRETFYDYWIKCNAATPPTGELLMQSLQANLFFAKHPMVKFASKLPEHITVRVFVGLKGFVGRFNANIKEQLEAVIGSERLKFTLFKEYGHHFYGSNEFIEMLNTISLTDLNDGELLMN